MVTDSQHYDEHSLFESMMARFDRAAERLNLERNLYKILRSPSREITVYMPVHRVNGEIDMVTGYRVQYTVARGTMMGGLRFGPNITLDEMRAGAAWSTFKCALVDIPFGGSQGGVVCDPKELQPIEIERITRRYTADLIDMIGPERDIITPDINSSDQEMAWVMDTYSMHARHTVNAIVTGKPLEMGGSQGSIDATAYGALCVINEAIKYFGFKPEVTRVVIQGAGRRGGRAAAMLYAAGYKVIAISDVDDGIFNSRGLDVPAALSHFGKQRTFKEFGEADHLSTTDLIKLDCEILILAATHEQITSRNAGDIKCKILCEVSDGATTPQADTILYDNGVYIIPDILANAGGAIARHLEWVQDRMGFFWKKEEVMENIEDKMVTSFKEVVAYSEKHSVYWRNAAYMRAIDRFATDLKMRGIYA